MKLFENLVVKYYKFIIKMNKILKFNKLIQYRDIKSMKLGVYSTPTFSKL